MRIGSANDPYTASITPEGNLMIELRGLQVLARPDDTDSDDIEMLSHLLDLTEWPESVDLFNTSFKSKELIKIGYKYTLCVADGIEQCGYGWNPIRGAKRWLYINDGERLMTVLERDGRVVFMKIS